MKDDFLGKAYYNNRIMGRFVSTTCSKDKRKFKASYFLTYNFPSPVWTWPIYTSKENLTIPIETLQPITAGLI